MGWGKGNGGGGLLGVLSQLIGGGKGGYGKKQWSAVQAASKKKPETLVWIGGLPKVGKGKAWKEANKELQELIKAAGLDCKFAEIAFKGTGAAVMGSAEDAANAITTLAGTQFRGSTLEFDAWTKGEKKKKSKK